MSRVGIVMGSDSDLPVMRPAMETLEKFGVEFDVTVISAHRMPDIFFEYAKGAEEKYDVLIAGAGGAAHLPGMAAAVTPIPVIGVPIQTKALGGVDSLYSIVQMPAGIPVATVAINGAKNAALLALKIISVRETEIRKKLKEFSEELKDEVVKKKDRLEAEGYKLYLDSMGK